MMAGFAAAAASSTASGIQSAIGNRKGRRFAKAAAQKQMDFQERMSSTQYQRGMTDMKAAGLNPILMASGGMSAAAPGGAAQSPTDQSIELGLEGAINTGISAAKAGSERKILKQEERTAYFRMLKEHELGMLYRNQSDKALAERINIKLLRPGLEAEAAIDRGRLGKYTRKLNRITNSALGAARSVVTGKAAGK